MKRILWILLLAISLSIPASAAEWTAPEVEGEAGDYMPQQVESFGEGIWYILRTTISGLMPSMRECAQNCIYLVAASMVLSLLSVSDGSGNAAAQLCGVAMVACILLRPAHTMISLGLETVQALSEYTKLLLPVLTASLAAQGGTTTSAALYTATALFDAVVSSLAATVLVPFVYMYLALSVVKAAMGDETVKMLQQQTKGVLTWMLKLGMYVFTGYISITGVVSGSVDAAAVKAAKMTISSAVPVVGGILSDASESILVSAELVKNSVGVYGLLAVLAIVLSPFLRIAIQYCLVKLTSGICAMLTTSRVYGLMQNYCTAMGLLMGITGCVSLMMLISIVCFLKGMG